MEDFQENIKTLLNNANAGEIKKIAGLTGQSIETTKEVLKKISETPDISEQAKAFLWSKESPEVLKVFNAGHEKGRNEGFSEGFAKGVTATAVAATVFIVAGYMFFKKES